MKNLIESLKHSNTSFREKLEVFRVPRISLRCCWFVYISLFVIVFGTFGDVYIYLRIEVTYIDSKRPEVERSLQVGEINARKFAMGRNMA
jgi:hypothetical protein